MGFPITGEEGEKLVRQVFATSHFQDVVKGGPRSAILVLDRRRRKGGGEGFLASLSTGLQRGGGEGGEVGAITIVRRTEKKKRGKGGC